jgi:branched-chain amino acid transport system substrate-binding protein
MTDIYRRSVLLDAVATAGLAASARAQEGDIVVGAPNALTGGYGEGGRQVVNGLRIAVDQINANGGIKALQERKLRLVPADTSSDNPAQAASVTRRVITEDKATILVGAHVSTVTLAAQVEAERAQVPLITTAYADSIVEKGYKYTFKIPPQSSVLSAAGLDDLVALYHDLKHEPVTRIAIFYGSDANSQALGSAYMELAKQRKLDVVAHASLPSGISDPTPVIGPVLSGKPQFIILNLFTDGTILITRALRNLGVKVPLVGSGSRPAGGQPDGHCGLEQRSADQGSPGIRRPLQEGVPGGTPGAAGGRRGLCDRRADRPGTGAGWGGRPEEAARYAFRDKCAQHPTRRADSVR